MQQDTKKKFLIDLAFLITVVAIIYFVFKFLAGYLLPFVIGLIIAFIVQKPTKFISKHTRVPKGVCSLILVIFTFAVFATVVTALFYFLYSVISNIAMTLPTVIEDISEAYNILNGRIDELIKHLPMLAQNSFDDIITGLIADAGKAVTGWLPKFAASVALAAPEYIVIVIVTIVATCYFAKDFDKIKAWAKGIVKPKYIELAVEIKDIAYKNIFKLLKSYIIIMGITFVELSIGFLILRVPNSFFIAFIISIVDILPVLGCGTVLIPWGIVALVQGNYLLGIGILVLYLLILIIRNIIEPKIIGEQVGMHPLLTLIAIFVGLRFFGVIGVFTLPVVAIIVLQLYKRNKLNFLSFSEKNAD